MNTKTLAAIVPCYNEEKNVREVYKALKQLQRSIDANVIIIFVNDCSTDNTLAVMKEIKVSDRSVRILNFTKNAGEWVGFRVALKNFDCDYAVSFPGDLQIPHKLIKELFIKIQNNKNLQVVHGHGYPHGNGISSTIFWMWLFFRFYGRIIQKQVDTFLISWEIIDKIKGCDKFHDIVPLEIFSAKRYSFIKFRKLPRLTGRSKYDIIAQVRMFTYTILLSIDTRLWGFNSPSYEIIH